jgi:uncharacterized protein YceK
VRAIACINLVLSVLLSGCVGVITMHNPEKSYNANDVKLGNRGWCCSAYQPISTKSEVLAIWGEPDKKWSEAGTEKWLYKQSSLSWAAVIPVIILPIPLGVPTGHNTTTLSFRAEKIVSATSSDREGLIAVCGLFPNDVNSKWNFHCLYK